MQTAVAVLWAATAAGAPPENLAQTCSSQFEFFADNAHGAQRETLQKPSTRSTRPGTDVSRTFRPHTAASQSLGLEVGALSALYLASSVF